MTALIGFVRELGAELVRRADAINKEGEAGRLDDDREAMIVAVAVSTALRQIGESITAAAKKTLLA
ncbi:MAG TPA: hypothetical protein VI172_16125 [Candidatus Dormibacteraeota bacterium]|jgi:hypothetical protein